MSIHDSRADRLAFALKHGYDCIGIHYAHHRHPSPCTCCWGSAAHGDHCPKHGVIGESIESEVNVLCRRVMELEAERVELREEVACYEAMKEGVAVRIADLEAERNALRETCKLAAAWIRESLDQYDAVPRVLCKLDAVIAAALRRAAEEGGR